MLRIPYGILAPIIVFYDDRGLQYSKTGLDIINAFFAVLGYLMRKLNFDTIPLPLASRARPWSNVHSAVTSALGGDYDFYITADIGNLDRYFRPIDSRADALHTKRMRNAPSCKYLDIGFFALYKYRKTTQEVS